MNQVKVRDVGGVDERTCSNSRPKGAIPALRSERVTERDVRDVTGGNYRQKIKILIFDNQPKKLSLSKQQ